jgi:hypothetical protein
VFFYTIDFLEFYLKSKYGFVVVSFDDESNGKLTNTE